MPQEGFNTAGENLENTAQQEAPHEKVVDAAYSPEKPKKGKFFIILFLILILASLVSLGYFFFFKDFIAQKISSMEKSVRELELTQPEPTQKEIEKHYKNIFSTCKIFDDTLVSEVSHPKLESEILIIGGFITKENKVETLPLFRASNGRPDLKFDKESEGEYRFSILDKDKNELRFVNFGGTMILYSTPNAPQEITDFYPLAMAPLYDWNDRYLSIEKEGENIYFENIHIRLTEDYIKSLPDGIFVNDRETFTALVDPVMRDFKECSNEGSDVPSSRILEFDLLPIIKKELKPNFEKGGLETNAEDIIDLLLDTIARLDPQTTTPPLSADPSFEGDVRIENSLGSMAIFSLDRKKNIRFGNEVELEFKEYNYKDYCFKLGSQEDDTITCDNTRPTGSVVVIKNLQTGESKNLLFSNRNDTSSAFDYTFRANPNANNVHIEAFRQDYFQKFYTF